MLTRAIFRNLLREARRVPRGGAPLVLQPWVDPTAWGQSQFLDADARVEQARGLFPPELGVAFEMEGKPPPQSLERGALERFIRERMDLGIAAVETDPDADDTAVEAGFAGLRLLSKMTALRDRTSCNDSAVVAAGCSAVRDGDGDGASAVRVVTTTVHVPLSDGGGEGPSDLFAYRIRIINGSELSVRLVSRHWRFVDRDGALVAEVVAGSPGSEGVVGQQPTLPPGAAFEYTSGCRIPTAASGARGGVMTGGFHMEVVVEGGADTDADAGTETEGGFEATVGPAQLLADD